MEGKSNVTKIVLVIIVVLAVLIGTIVYFVSNKEDKDNNSENGNSTSATDNGENSDKKVEKDNDGGYEKKTTEIDVKESSLENKLEIGEWGNASKAVTGNFSSEYNRIGYIKVPVSVTKIIKGKDAEKQAKEWYATERPNYTYDEPKSHMEWVIIEYKVDLSDVKIKEGTDGIDVNVEVSIVNDKGGASVILDNESYLVASPINMSEKVKAKESGIYKAKVMVKLPIGASDYTIRLGSKYDNTNEGKTGTMAHFRGQ